MTVSLSSIVMDLFHLWWTVIVVFFIVVAAVFGYKIGMRLMRPISQ